VTLDIVTGQIQASSVVSCLCPTDCLRKFASKSVHSFLKYRVHKTSNRDVKERTDRKHYVPPAGLDWQVHKNYLTLCHSFLPYLSCLLNCANDNCSRCTCIFSFNKMIYICPMTVLWVEHVHAYYICIDYARPGCATRHFAWALDTPLHDSVGSDPV